MKINDFVRTKYGIAKYIDDEVKSLKVIVIDRYIAYDHVEGYENVITPSEIIKSSPNIIDLIEVGDYVNGCLVLDIAQSPEKALYLNDISQKGALIPVCNYQIKSIVTKECFESMEYKVKE